MIARPTRWIACAILALLATGVALALTGQVSLVTGPTSTAQVGVLYSSGITIQGGIPPYSAALWSGTLPPGLNLGQPTGNSSFIPLTGTPLPAGSGNTYNFAVQLTDSAQLPPDSTSPSTGPDSQAAVRRRGLAQNGNHTASIYPSFSITVQPAAPSPTPVPPSVWMAMTGLAGAGLFRLRQKRRG
jgi:hypothetical protein